VIVPVVNDQNAVDPKPTPSLDEVWNWKLPVEGASTLPVQRTENRSWLTPGPGELVLQPKLTFSVRCRTAAPVSAMLLK
jgi:hypothetical protein